MKLEQQFFQIISQDGFSIINIDKHIEYCARICYKSQDKITEDSYVSFVRMLKDKGHSRALEFGTVHLQMDAYQFKVFQDMLIKYRIYNDQWFKYNVSTGTVFITLNYRYYLDILKVYPSVAVFFDSQDSEYYPKRYTVHMILSRGIMDEFRTHIGLSHLAESTRWVNYSRDKFGKELTFVKPSYLNWNTRQIITTENNVDHDRYVAEVDDDGTIWDYLSSLLNAEKRYLALIGKGWTPQQARDVLPLAIKSELISCGFSDAWENFFKRRTAKDAHPMAREIALSLQKEMQSVFNLKQ